jgi:superfamily II DNA or RNA helicase
MTTAVAGTEWRVGERVRVRGRSWQIAGITHGQDCAALRLTANTASAAGSLTILTPFDRPARQTREADVRVVRPRRWLHELDRLLLDVCRFGGLTATTHAAIRLMPHQLEPVLAIVRHGVTRLLIADAVGLGKTIQAGMILIELATRDDDLRALVLVPAGLRDQWCAELSAHFGLSAVRADAAWLRITTSERPTDVNPWSLPGVYVASYDFVKRPEALRPLENVTWDVVVVDEAHNAAAGTDRRAAVHAIACRAMRVVLLTATPPSGSASHLAALYQIGRIREEEPRLTVFARSREDVDLDRPRKSVVLAVTPSDAERRMHALLERYSSEVWNEARRRGDTRAALVSIILRKRALSSAGSLAASVERRIGLLAGIEQPALIQLSLPLDEDPLEDDEPSGALAAPGLPDQRREWRWLSAIAEAARAAARAESKMLRLLRLLARVHEPIVVFTEYRDTLTRLERAIAASGRSVITLHGAMRLTERSGIPALFRQGARTLLATDAAAEGLNLHEASRIVIHYELPWNPARLEQRIGRVDRIGQTRRVHDIALVTADSAERLVLAPLRRGLHGLRRSRGLAGSGDHSAPHRAGLLHRLTESTVAETILSGTTLPDPETIPSPHEECELLDLRGEAREELSRLEQHRILAARSPGGDAALATSAGPIASQLTCRSAAIGPGLILLYVVAAENTDGVRVHAEPFALLVHGTAATGSTPQALRTLVERFANTTAAPLASPLNEARARVHVVTFAASQAQHVKLRARRQALASVRRSAAQQLVQQGLFEHVHSRRRVDPPKAIPPDSIETGPADPPSIETTIALAAAIELRRHEARR